MYVKLKEYLYWAAAMNCIGAEVSHKRSLKPRGSE